MFLSESDLYQYQKTAVDHITSRNGSMLWLDIGLGKTISSLTALGKLLDSMKVSAALVLAPVKVIESVWPEEVKKWTHTRWMEVSLIRGTPKERIKSLVKPAHIYLINYEQIPWLTETLEKHWINRGSRLPFDMVIFDEVSKMKTATTKRGRSFAKILKHFSYRVGLTGTPAANGLIDLHGQFLMVDGGKRLGPNITSYRNRWFLHDAYARKWNPRRGAMDDIKKQIQDITIEMKAEDYLSLPPVVEQDIKIELPEDLQEKYKEFEREFFLELGDGEELEAFNAASKSMKCRQLANGAVYTAEDRSEWKGFHELKLDAVEELMGSLNGRPLLVCNQFRHDVQRLLSRFPDAVVLDRTDVAEKVRAWNAGKIKMLIGHPASMGHGLNLQYGGNHIAWYGVPWSLELYDQAIGRIARNGQKGSVVMNHRIVAAKTVEEAILGALATKGKTQVELREAIKQYRLSLAPSQ